MKHVESPDANEPESKALGLFDAICIILGIIIGAGIYETPATIFSFMGDPWYALGVWAACGILALIGGLCYAELATAYPRSGGDYVYLTRAYGPLVGYLFGWAQLAVIQTGSIGLMAYIFGDYASRLYELPYYSSAIYAAGAVVAITLLNAMGVVLGKWVQNLLTVVKVLGLVGIVIVAFLYPAPTKSISGTVTKAEGNSLTFQAKDGSEKTITINEATKLYVNGSDSITILPPKEKENGEGKDKKAEPQKRPATLADMKAPADAISEFVVRAAVKNGTSEATIVRASQSTRPPWDLVALAMVFVFLTYGGWNDAAFVAAEVKDPSRNIPRALIFGILGVMGVYLLVNFAYIRAVGFEAAISSKEIAADAVKQAPWAHSEKAIITLVMISALGAVNGLIFTSSRIFSTLGADYSLFSPLGAWSKGSRTPIVSLLIQMLISLGMVLAVGTEMGQSLLNQALEYLGQPKVNWAGQSGFNSLLRCTAPIFWIFFLLTAMSLFILRRNDADVPRPFRVPGFPIIPLIFVATCGYLVYSGANYAGSLGWIGALLVAAGIPFFVFSRRSGFSSHGLPQEH
ncbi:MAG: amino acid permease [Gemmataceae bacterium]|nr:amino acid permease [Gemmataceae bacterium]